MPALDPLIFDLQVRYRDLEQNTRNASRLFTTETDRMKRASADLTARLQRDSGAIAGSIKGLAGSFAAYFSGKELVGLIDGFTRLQNSLRVAGLEGAALDAAQKRLFASAQKYGVEIGGLTSLFGTLTQASKELGVTQADVFKVTDTVSASLKITGATAEQAGGALLQLGQALRGGKVQAEEYNSLLDGLYARISAAVPGWVSEPTRDDIISEMYLATQEGTLRLADIELNARRFAMAAVAMWESKFSPRSIDAPMFDDGKRTLADMIPDPAALAAFEALDDLRVGRGCNAMEGC